MKQDRPVVTPKHTLASAIERQLHEEILTGDLQPNAKLNLRELSERFGTALSPIREALNRLVPEGLVRQADHRGFIVAPIRMEEAADLAMARCWINEIALRDSIAHGTREWEEELLVAEHRISRATRSEEGETLHREWSKAHRHFHAALISACRSKTLLRLCDGTFVAAERYRHIARRSGKYTFDRNGHKPIMQAAIDRNADLAVELLTRHFQRTAGFVRTVLSEDQQE